MTLDIAPPAPAAAPVTLRPIEPDDVPAAARIVYEAFAGIHDRHRFPRDFPTLDAAASLVEGFVAHPGIWGVVAESGGRVVGSNFLDERGPVAGVGPITVDPGAQAAGVGRMLMEAVLRRGSSRRGVRLLQDAFNTASLALYASLGFEVRDPVAVMAGRPEAAVPVGIEVRPLRESDLPAAEELGLRVHGHERTRELRDAIEAPPLTPLAAVRDGRLTAYATTLSAFPVANAAAETDADLQALIAGAGGEVSFLLPTRQSELLRWALGAGLRVVKPMTYMTVGEYREPRGAWIPSVLC
jgi:ribosomal protein S18 acetylase RimI-like enzyme